MQVLIKITVANLRPPVAELDGLVPDWIRALLLLCWAPLQDDRPDAAAVCEVIPLEAIIMLSLMKIIFCFKLS